MSADLRKARPGVRSGYAADIGSSVTVPMCCARQRQRIQQGMRDRGLPVVFVTDQHRALFERARIGWSYGTPLGKALRSISYSAAQRLIDTLQEIPR